jgi:hypothetical protein
MNRQVRPDAENNLDTFPPAAYFGDRHQKHASTGHQKCRGLRHSGGRHCGSGHLKLLPDAVVRILKR